VVVGHFLHTNFGFLGTKAFKFPDPPILNNNLMYKDLFGKENEKSREYDE
jgi:hypothetical protein